MGRSTHLDDWWSAEDIGTQLGVGRGTNPISALAGAGCMVQQGEEAQKDLRSS